MYLPIAHRNLIRSLLKAYIPGEYIFTSVKTRPPT